MGTAPLWTKRVPHRCACEAPGRCVCGACCTRLSLEGRPWPGAGPSCPPAPMGTSGQGRPCHGAFPPCAGSAMNAEQGALLGAAFLTVKSSFSICDGQYVILPTTSRKCEMRWGASPPPLLQSESCWGGSWGHVNILAWNRSSFLLCPGHRGCACGSVSWWDGLCGGHRGQEGPQLCGLLGLRFALSLWLQVTRASARR